MKGVHLYRFFSPAVAVWGAVIISALLYASAFVYPELWWPAIFLFLIPLFYVAPFLRALHGFVWGLLFWAVHSWGIFMLAYSHASLMPAVLGYGVWVLFQAGQSALWILCGARFATEWFAKNSVWRWGIGTFLYFTWIYEKGAWPVNWQMGYPFAHPLLPLAEAPSTLASLSWFGPHLLTVCLIIGAVGCISLLQKRRGAVCILAWLPFMIGLFDKRSESVPAWLTSIGYVGIQKGGGSFEDAAEQQAVCIKKLLASYPEISCIVMPESACPYPLNTHDACIAALTKQVPEQTLLILGSHRCAKNGLFGSCYIFAGSRITQTYDKTHLFPFGEYAPWPWCASSLFKNLLFTNRQPFTEGTVAAPVFCIARAVTATPVLCSELLFCNHYRPPFGADLIVLLANDGWVSACPFYAHLFLLRSRYLARLLNKGILYVTHTGCWWCGKQGEIRMIEKCE